jgi:hypothetical protein
MRACQRQEDGCFATTTTTVTILLQQNCRSPGISRLASPQRPNKNTSPRDLPRLFSLLYMYDDPKLQSNDLNPGQVFSLLSEALSSAFQNGII